MLSLTKRLQATLTQHLRAIATCKLLSTRAEINVQKRRPRPSSQHPFRNKKMEEKSEWWIVDGEMHEIGDNVPPRERFVIPRDNLPNKRRKQLREQFMRRTRLVLKESHLHLCTVVTDPIHIHVNLTLGIGQLIQKGMLARMKGIELMHQKCNEQRHEMG